MKTQLSILLLFAMVFYSCKTIEGTYCSISQYTGACIEFKNKDEILYHTGTDTGELGLDYGTYRFIGKTLIIKFKKVPEKYRIKSDESYAITHFEPTANDSTTFKIACKGTWFTNVYYQDKNSRNKIFGNTTDPDGIVKFQMNKNKLPTQLTAECKMSKIIIPINENGNYAIDVTLNERIAYTFYNRGKGEIRKYHLTQLQDTIFLEEIRDKEYARKFYKKLIIKQ